MAKVSGLNIPPEFLSNFEKTFRQNWTGSTNQISKAFATQNFIKKTTFAERSLIPSFLADWAALSEAQQSTWLKNWGDGSQQAFALYFQNNYYRQLNGLSLRSSPNFFTHPAGHLHFGTASSTTKLKFEITNNDYILQFPDNPIKPQIPSLCNFENIDEIYISLHAKPANWTDPGFALPFKYKIKIDYDGGYWIEDKTDQWEWYDYDNINFHRDYDCLNDYRQDAPATKITFEIWFYQSSADIYFFDIELTAIDLVLGSIRLNNSNHMRDIIGSSNLRLAFVKNQWSLTTADQNTSLECSFPYANGFPDE